VATGRTDLLTIGLLLVAAGLALAFAPMSADWFARFWPVFLILAGLVRVAGFAVERKPRSPLGGMLLMSVGTLLLAARVYPNLSLLQVYGRCWPLLLLIFGGVELIRYYSHPHALSEPTPILTRARLAIIFIIITTGVLANRMATRRLPSPTLLRLPIRLCISSTGSPYNAVPETSREQKGVGL
jgi:asparagine N-glycosylation enzyme membrane subunit Stt3